MRRALWIFTAVVATMGIVWAVMPAPHKVELARVTQGPLQLTVAATGKARIRDKFLIAAPVTGTLQRLSLLPGDVVAAGELLTAIEPLSATPLDARDYAVARARADALVAATMEATAALEGRRLALAHAQQEWERASALAAEDVLPRNELERAQLTRDVRENELAAAQQGLQRARAELAAGRASLKANQTGKSARSIPVTSPIAGQVLRVLRKDAGPVEAGAALVELGDPTELEVVLELLSSEAIDVKPGAKVTLERWGGALLIGAVGYIEPSAYTKVSALGVTEQRVDVVVHPAGDGFSGLADGYHVEGRIVVIAHDEALQVPVSALVRNGDAWTVFVLDEGRASLRSVELGAVTEDSAEVRSGLMVGEAVIVHPSDKIEDRQRVEEEPRSRTR